MRRHHHMLLAGCITAVLIAILSTTSDTDVRDEQVLLREHSADGVAPRGTTAVIQPAPGRAR